MRGLLARHLRKLVAFGFAGAMLLAVLAFTLVLFGLDRLALALGLLALIGLGSTVGLGGLVALRRRGGSGSDDALRRERQMRDLADLRLRNAGGRAGGGAPGSGGGAARGSQAGVRLGQIERRLTEIDVDGRHGVSELRDEVDEATAALRKRLRRLKTALEGERRERAEMARDLARMSADVADTRDRGRAMDQCQADLLQVTATLVRADQESRQRQDDLAAEIARLRSD